MRCPHPGHLTDLPAHSSLTRHGLPQSGFLHRMLIVIFYPPRRSGSGKALLPPRPLRTVQAPFDAYSSSFGQRAYGCTRSPALALRTTCTLLRGSQQRNRRKPHRQERCARRHFCNCLLKSVCLTFRVRQHQREVCRLSRGVMSQPLSDPLQIGLRLLPPPLPTGSSASLASRFPVRQLLVIPGDYGLTTFRRCTRVVEVASLRRWLAVCAGGVRSLRTWPRTVLVQAVQQLALVLCDDACDASPGLTLPTPSWFPTALLLAVAATARA